MWEEAIPNNNINVYLLHLIFKILNQKSPLYYVNLIVDIVKKSKTYVFEKNVKKISLTKFKFLKKVIIPKTVKVIKHSAFYGCENLTDIIIPKNVKRIENKAFFYCIKLIHIVIPDSVIYFGNNIFFGCKQLVKVKLPINLTIIKKHTFSYCEKLIDITIPNNVSKIEVNS